MTAKIDLNNGDITEYHNHGFIGNHYMISTKIIIDYSIVEPYCIIIMLSEPNIICINNLLNWEKDISISV